MREDVIDFLKSLLEGRLQGSEWHEWLQVNDPYLRENLSPGSFLRLKFHPLAEAKSILEEKEVAFDASDSLEWLDIDSRSGRCRYCGEQLDHNKAGWTWYPKGCFRLMV
ncbi:MAG TPA: hypothetical protein VK395_04335 [Gemmataceae bacterium]|nr:hypothetical protein [Gemmataceae bacterium]